MQLKNSLFRFQSNRIMLCNATFNKNSVMLQRSKLDNSRPAMVEESGSTCSQPAETCLLTLLCINVSSAIGTHYIVGCNSNYHTRQPTGSTIIQSRPRQPTGSTIIQSRPRQHTGSTIIQSRPRQPTGSTIIQSRPQQPTGSTIIQSRPRQPTCSNY